MPGRMEDWEGGLRWNSRMSAHEYADPRGDAVDQNFHDSFVNGYRNIGPALSRHRNTVRDQEWIPIILPAPLMSTRSSSPPHVLRQPRGDRVVSELVGDEVQ